MLCHMLSLLKLFIARTEAESALWWAADDWRHIASCEPWTSSYCDYKNFDSFDDELPDEDAVS